jgi:Domain of unknown function (DUF4160)
MIQSGLRRLAMPTISMFYGVVIRMYCDRAEHNPPHFHAYYQENSAVVSIESCEIIKGELPRKQAKLVTAWAELHKEELIADWGLATQGELPFKIQPLQ